MEELTQEECDARAAGVQEEYFKQCNKEEVDAFLAVALSLLNLVGSVHVEKSSELQQAVIAIQTAREKLEEQ